MTSQDELLLGQEREWSQTHMSCNFRYTAPKKLTGTTANCPPLGGTGFSLASSHGGDKLGIMLVVYLLVILRRGDTFSAKAGLQEGGTRRNRGGQLVVLCR